MPFPIRPTAPPMMTPRPGMAPRRGGGAPNPQQLAALRAAVLARLAPRAPMGSAPAVGGPAMPIQPAPVVPGGMPTR